MEPTKKPVPTVYIYLNPEVTAPAKDNSQNILEKLKQKEKFESFKSSSGSPTSPKDQPIGDGFIREDIIVPIQYEEYLSVGAIELPSDQSIATPSQEARSPSQEGSPRVENQEDIQNPLPTPNRKILRMALPIIGILALAITAKRRYGTLSPKCIWKKIRSSPKQKEIPKPEVVEPLSPKPITPVDTIKKKAATVNPTPHPIRRRRRCPFQWPKGGHRIARVGRQKVD